MSKPMAQGKTASAALSAPPKTHKRRPSARGALSLIGLCFIVSAFVRGLDPQSAFAQEVANAVSALMEDTTLPPDVAPVQLDTTANALLQALRTREAQLDTREARLADREQTLAVTEARIRTQIEALDEAQQRLEQTLARAEGAASEDIARLTSVYENMDSDNAAAIFETMDVNFAAGFLIRMRPEIAAEIIAGLSTQQAYAVSVIMAGRNANAPRQ